jgi:hypothetical protein
MAQARMDTRRRKEISERLRASPFLLEQAARQWRALWQAGAR